MNTYETFPSQVDQNIFVNHRVWIKLMLYMLSANFASHYINYVQ